MFEDQRHGILCSHAYRPSPGDYLAQWGEVQRLPSSARVTASPRRRGRFCLTARPRIQLRGCSQFGVSQRRVPHHPADPSDRVPSHGANGLERTS